jgi:predicted RNA-binding Zn-ribbon protein involved in translation (DUF1610 family)
LGEIRQTIVPYRANRRALHLESSEDYELVFIRLCAGEGGFFHTAPEEVRAKFAAEALNTNPDLTIVDSHKAATVTLNKDHLAKVMDQKPDLTFAPPDQRFSPATADPAPKPSRRAPDENARRRRAGASAPAICRSCRGKLPLGGKVKFCPTCGEDQQLTHCPECQTELQPAWRHCINCGSAVRKA